MKGLILLIGLKFQIPNSYGGRIKVAMKCDSEQKRVEDGNGN